MHIHLNPVGGIAGDMFVAAVLDLFPHLEDPMMEALHKVDTLADVNVRLVAHNDSVLTGRKFELEEKNIDHSHSRYVELRAQISGSKLSVGVRELACCILEHLAVAESAVHGIPLEQVTLHEAGSLDSLTDIVCSAFLIDALGLVTWSSDALPAGRGLVKTAHGELPLPVPAVAHLLTGCPVYDDGRFGERITPTGASILRALNPEFDSRNHTMILSRIGTGFGNSRFQGISNVLRLIMYDDQVSDLQNETVAVLEFEIDDQSPEDLSIGLDRIRKMPGVRDVIQIAATGKKGRITMHVQILAGARYLKEIAVACTTETSTLGVRCRLSERLIVNRETILHQDGESIVPVKVAKRPGGTSTAKVEADHLGKAGNFSQRKQLKQKTEVDAESEILKRG